ncbi:MAG: hypothetical protein GX228_08385 [Firmicutes bacterium]|jgi:hypothetical protein|nr:hypothetical protein [Bacillota bacterium]NLL88929.1 hypothetical protein [Bacillota bacterium]HKM18401.1 hypothetical protein [Limnochordia bacterium]
MSTSFIDPYDAVADQPLLILTPRRWIFRRLGRILGLLFIGAFFSFNVFVYISIPVYLLAFYFIYELSPTWHAHRYSMAVLYILTGMNLIAFLLLGSLLRNWFYAVFTRFF